LHHQQPEKDKRNVDFAPPMEKFLRTPMVVTHAMGLIAYSTSSRCKAHCAGESNGTRWDGQRNDVITVSRDAK